jgi:hypothetical protein
VDDGCRDMAEELVPRHPHGVFACSSLRGEFQCRPSLCFRSGDRPLFIWNMRRAHSMKGPSEIVSAQPLVANAQGASSFDRERSATECGGQFPRNLHGTMMAPAVVAARKLSTDLFPAVTGAVESSVIAGQSDDLTAQRREER